MLCDICHEKEATIELTRTDLLGKSLVVHICPKCASEKGITPGSKDIAASVVQLLKRIALKKIAEDENRCCPVCGQKVSVIKNEFRAGCPECYAIFKDEIRAALKNRGVSNGYTGSLPRRLASFKSSLTDRLAIQAKLFHAVECEEYEKAAVYRDYLRVLEKQAIFGADSESNNEQIDGEKSL